MIGDRVKIGMGSVEISAENVPVYDLLSDAGGKVIFDAAGAATPKVIGGVKGGSTGEIVGQAVRVMKASLVGGRDGAAMGMEYIQIYPVRLDYYQKVGWFPQDFVHIQGSYNQH